MTFRMSLLFQGDSSQAEKEVRQLDKAVDEAKRSTEQLGRAGRTSASGVDRLSDAERRAARAAVGVGQANRMAAGSLGNLTAQFNDLGVMMAAGQNPLQLALQQGTQITQVIGPMGAAGAVKALGSAFVAMLSPVNLITIGAIAAGAAMTQWLFGASEDSKVLEDALSDLEDQLGAYQKAAEAAKVPTDELRKKFGEQADEVRRLLEARAESERREVEFKLRAVLTTELDESELDLPRFDFGDQVRMSRLFDLPLLGGRERRERQAMVNAVLDDYAALALAAEGSVSDQIAALEDLRVSFKRAAEASGDISEEENARLAAMEDLLLSLRELRADDEGLGDVAARQEKAWRQYYASRIAGEEQVRDAHQRAMEVYVATREASATDLATAEERLAQLEQENTLRWATLKFGEDSVEVRALEVQAAREANEEWLASLTVAESVKEELRQSFERKLDLAGVDITSGISSAAAAAQTLASNLGISLNLARQIVAATGNVGGVSTDPTVGGFEENDPRSGNVVWTGGYDRSWKPWTPRKKRGGGGGGRGGASRAEREAEREREAVENLIERLEEQLDIVRETDPVQKEMIRNRETLAAATDAERRAVEQLIAERQREEKAVAGVEERQEFFKDNAYDLLRGIARGGDEAASAWERVGQAIEDAAWQAVLLGEGPFGSMFGLEDSGGLLGALADAFTPAKAGAPTPKLADGGLITGPGSGTSDSIPLWGSSGEFMMNARATARHRHLLEALNAGGGIPGFARGGPIGGAGGSGLDMGPRITIENHGSTPVQGEVQEEVDAQGGRRYRIILADAVGQALTTRGGGARRAMRETFGVRPKGTRR